MLQYWHHISVPVSSQCNASLLLCPHFFLPSLLHSLVTTNRRANRHTDKEKERKREKERHTSTSIGGHSFLGCSQGSMSSNDCSRHSILAG